MVFYPRRCEYCRTHPKGPLRCSLLSRPHIQPCRSCKGHRECIDPAQPRPHVVQFSRNQSPRASASRVPRTSPARFVTGSLRADSADTIHSPKTHINGSLLNGELIKVLISLDVGSGNIKAAWRPVFDNTQHRALYDHLISGCRPIIWPNNLPSCPAKVAYKQVENALGQSELVQIWGVAVDSALEDEDIRESDILQWFKPAIFSSTNARSFHERDLGEKLENLKAMAEVHDVSNLAHIHALDSRKLYTNLLEHAYKYVLEKIRGLCPPLDRLCETRPEALDQLIEVALPVPAKATGVQEMMVLQAAKEAGLPKAFPVAEPAAAAAFMMQNAYEDRPNSGMPQTPTTGNVLILDAGAGSLDAIVCTIQSESDPGFSDSTGGSSEFKTRHTLKEAVPGMSSWKGGSTVNEAFREWITTEYREKIAETFRRAMSSPQFISKVEIVDLLVHDFEHRKRHFRYKDDDHVKVRMHGSSGVFATLPRQKMIDFFQEQLKSSCDLIDQQMRRLRKAHEESGQRPGLDQIILVGGGNNSTYIQEEIRRKYATSRTSVVLPGESAQTSTAKGGLLIAMDKSFIAERFLLHNYFFSWDDVTNEVRSKPDGSLVVVHDEALGERRAKDVSRVILKAGDRIPWKHTAKLAIGIRTLAKRPRSDDTGFDPWSGTYLIEEDFLMSDTSSSDGLNIHYPPNDFHKIGTLNFEISKAWCERNCTKVIKNGNGTQFWQVEYQVSVVVNGMNIEFSIGVPEHGVFEGEDECEYAIFKKGSILWDESGGFWKV